MLMTAPVFLPIVAGLGFDHYWFTIMLTVNMEIGLITPPVGLNLYVITGIVPNVSLPTILRGATPFMFCIVLGIIMSIFTEIVTFFTRICNWPIQLNSYSFSNYLLIKIGKIP